MKTLELFAGSRSFSKVAEKLGHEVYTTDNQDFEAIDQVCDIFDFDINKIPYEPDIIWASPPCTTFSIASCYHHWNKDKTPKTEKCLVGIKIVKETINIINKLNPKYWFIENPRGLLRKQDYMQDLSRKTVTYCSYGDMRMKPTDIWTNFDFTTRPMCQNGNRDCHHEPAPRGSKTGTQGLKGDYLRSQIPAELFIDIFNDIKKGK
jgi:site-specific DNA-cytosine methylase